MRTGGKVGSRGNEGRIRRERERKGERKRNKGGGGHEEHWASSKRGREREDGGRGRREAVIKSDCIASRMSQESRISGDVKPCLTPQLDNCGCGS